MARKQITLEDFDRLEVDPTTGQLYWDGERVVTDMTLSLPWWGDAAVVGLLIVAILNWAEITPRRIIQFVSDRRKQHAESKTG